MYDLTTINDDNLGGIQLFRFAPRFFFSDLRDPNDLQFAPGLDWIKLEQIPETAGIIQEPVTDDAGEYFNITVSAQLPKERAIIDEYLVRYNGLPCVVRFTDQNGFDRLTGHELGELLLSHSSGSGEAASDQNGYRIIFKGKQLRKALFL